MSGSINFSLLFGNNGDTTSNLLSALYGGNTASTSNGVNALQALTTAEKNEAKDVAVTAKQPDVQRDIAAFKTAVAKAKTPADLLSDPAALKVLLTANGLGDQTDYTALAKKALLSDPADSKSLVNHLADTRWKTVAETYQFSTKGLAALQDPKVQETLANAYAEVSWRQSLDATTPGLSNAMTFRQEAGTITSVDQILGDKTLREVVTKALGIPQEIAYQSIEAQERAISNRLDLTRFKDPHFVDSFTQQYLLAAQTDSTTSSSASLSSLLV